MPTPQLLKALNISAFSGINIGGDNQKTTKASVSKALRAGLVEITNYLSCVMVYSALLSEIKVGENFVTVTLSIETTLESVMSL